MSQDPNKHIHSVETAIGRAIALPASFHDDGPWPEGTSPDDWVIEVQPRPYTLTIRDEDWDWAEDGSIRVAADADIMVQTHSVMGYEGLFTGFIGPFDPHFEATIEAALGVYRGMGPKDGDQ